MPILCVPLYLRKDSDFPPFLYADFCMKKNFKNSSIFNYEYLDKLSGYLKQDAIEQESKIVLVRRVLQAMDAIAQGERNEHYRYLKKNFTEHKSLEYILELLVKKEVPALQTISFDYSTGIFEVLRMHCQVIESAIITLLQRELALFITVEAPSIEVLAERDPFDFYTTILENLIEIRQFKITQLELLLAQGCDHALTQVCKLCDQLKQAFDTHLITNSRHAMRIAYMLDTHKIQLDDIWGSLRVSFLRIAARKALVELFEVKQEQDKAMLAAEYEQKESCDCCEHRE